MAPQGSQKPKVQSGNEIPDYDFFMFAHLQRFPGHCEATVTPRIRNMDVARLGDSSLLSFVSPSLSFYFIILNFTCYSIPSVWSISSVFSSQVLVHFKIFNCIKIIHATQLKNQIQGLLGDLVADSAFPMQGAQIQSLARELDPTCRSRDPVQPNK